MVNQHLEKNTSSLELVDSTTFSKQIYRIIVPVPTKTQLSNFLGTPGEDYFKGNPKSLNFYFLVIWWGKFCLLWGRTADLKMLDSSPTCFGPFLGIPMPSPGNHHWSLEADYKALFLEGGIKRGPLNLHEHPAIPKAINSKGH